MTLRDDLVQRLEAENDELRERVRVLEEISGIHFESPPQFMFTHSESVIFGLLLKNKLVHREAMMVALYSTRHEDEEAQIRIVDVWVCKMRRKLKSYGIEVRTQWGEGYFMPAESKQKAKELLAQFNGEVAA